MTEERVRRFGSGKAWEATAPFVQGSLVSAGPTIHLSGQVALDASGTVVGEGDMTVQTRQAFLNIRDLLAAVGSSMEDIVKLTYFTTDMSRWSEVAAVRAEFFPTVLPASTTVEVTRLHREPYLIEIDTIAVPSRTAGVRMDG